MMPVLILAIEHPALFVTFLVENTLGIGLRPVYISKSGDEREGIRTVQRESRAGIRRRLHRFFPDRLALLEEDNDAEVTQARVQVMIRAIPDDNPINRVSLLQIDFPPGIIGLFGVSGGFGFFVITVSVAIERQRRFAFKSGAALGSLAL